jgi:hypothetical protein
MNREATVMTALKDEYHLKMFIKLPIVERSSFFTLYAGEFTRKRHRNSSNWSTRLHQNLVKKIKQFQNLKNNLEIG